MRKAWTVFFAFVLLFASKVYGQEETEISRVFVTIEGLNGRVLTNSALLLRIYEYHSKVAPGDGRVRYLHNQAERDFFRALTPYGYYNYQLNSHLEKRDHDWYATYTVALGDPIPIGNVSIQIKGAGEQDPSFQKLINRLPIRSGAPLLHSDYESAKSQLRRHASERGYYQAAYQTSTLRIDVESYQAHIELILNTGPRYQFGDIRIAPGHLDEDVMRRFIPFEKGDNVSATELINLQLGLSDSDYFSRVEVQPLWTEASDKHQVPVNIEYEPNKRTHYQVGLGYGTDTGARLKFEQNRRWVNTRGHRFNAQLQASEILTNIGTRYVIPGSQPQSDQYILRALWTDEDSSTIRSERFTYGASWQSQRERLQRIYSIDWQDERDYFEGDIRKTQYLMPSAQWTRVETPNRLNVLDGWRLSLTLRGATKQLFSDSDFLQTLASAKYVHSFGSRTRALARIELGTSITSDFDQVPTSLRFFTGGDRSVRGYAYRSISPRNDNNEVEGARNLVVSSLEFDYSFRPNWRVAAFVDAGNAFNDIQESFKVGLGFGFRWQSPIGPVRFDFASGLSDPGDSLRLHLTIGPDL
ncbi:outer membrane protein assembly factor [Aliidiomarina taiwanensis]|uniref:Translocation and assembly module subunit TamA n=1 Tax=Aliidiomarina taiwanensis TaxID=946228 RepID=A0A432WVR5_9GAMM|nr:autotransporter assembly complex family protein [Aliidiomarina taiwanensis]RUO37862.1 outer membrane protein assembly factor [Aliidiomarina taiwanensis]